MSAHARVPLSTVDMDLHEVGRTAAQRLLEAIDGHRSHGVEFLPCRLLPPNRRTLPPLSPASELFSLLRWRRISADRRRADANAL